MLIRERLARSGALEHRIDYCIIHMRAQQSIWLTPFGDETKLRVIFEVGRFLSFKMRDANRPEPAHNCRRGNGGRALPEVDAAGFVSGRNDLRTKLRVMIAIIH